MATTKKYKKHPQGRPASTTQISQPPVQDTSNLFALSSFSPKGDLFAYVPLAVDKHRLRVYNITTGQAIADHIVDNTRISSMTWCALDPGQSDRTDDPQPSKKKRKKRDSTFGSEVKNNATEVVVLGLSDGTISCFSPSCGRVLRSLSHASSASAILATVVEEDKDQWLIWASGADGAIRLWNANKNEIVGSWKNDDRIPYTSLTTRPVGEEGRVDLLAANHSIRLLSKSGGIAPKKLQQAAGFTGHASPVKSTKWDLSKSNPTRFFSMAETDRFIYVWDIPDSPGTDGKAVASIPLDSNARSFCLAPSTGSNHPTTLLALSASGKITLYPVPHQIFTPSGPNHSPAKLPTVHPRSSIIMAPQKSSVSSQVIDVSFVGGEPGYICVARLVRGIRPVFTVMVCRIAVSTVQFQDSWGL